MNGPVLRLAAAPTQQASIPTIFRSEEAKSILEHPPVTRHDGFNILTYEHARLVDGERWVIDTWRKRLELYKDGTFIALGTFSELLGWPRDAETFSANPKVNSLALIEFTYDFLKTYNAILDLVEPLPISVLCQIGVDGAHEAEAPLWMAPHALHTLGYDHPRVRFEAPSDSITVDAESQAQQDQPHIEAGKIAYRLVEGLYHQFGMTSDLIPYVSLELEEVDPTAF